MIEVVGEVVEEECLVEKKVAGSKTLRWSEVADPQCEAVVVAEDEAVLLQLRRSQNDDGDESEAMIRFPKTLAPFCPTCVYSGRFGRDWHVLHSDRRYEFLVVHSIRAGTHDSHGETGIHKETIKHAGGVSRDK